MNPQPMSFDQMLDAISKNPSRMKAATELFSSVLSQKRQNEIQDLEINNREVIERLDLINNELGTARSIDQAIKVPFQFRSIRVESATDASVEIKLAFKSTQGTKWCTLKLNDTLSMDTLKNGYLFWDAQANKDISIVFGIDVRFTQGTLITLQSGNVIIGEGTRLDTETPATVDDTAGGTVISPANAEATRRLFYNVGPNACEIIEAGDAFGDGVTLAVGGWFEYRGSAEVVGICDATETAEIRILRGRI